MLFVGGIETELTYVDAGLKIGTQTPDHFNLEHLPIKERGELDGLLTSFADIFSDVPGKAAVVKHSIVLKPNSRPVLKSTWLRKEKTLEEARSNVVTRTE